jgi:hypothetical protein
LYLLTFSGLFFTLDLPFPVAGIDYKARTADIIGDGTALFSLTHLDDIGRFVAAVLKRPEETKNAVIRVAGDTQCANAMLEEFEKKIGTPFKVHHKSSVVVTALLKKALEHKKYDIYFSNAINLFTGDGVFLHIPLNGLMIFSELKLIDIPKYVPFISRLLIRPGIFEQARQ